MPTPTKGPRLGGSPAHQRHILSNLAIALFEHGRITTTHAKARKLRPVAERLITFAKKGDLHSRRQVLTVVPDKTVVHTLFTEIGPSYAGRQGGYTRIIKIGPRKGDNAPMAVIELVRDEEATTRSRRRARRQPAASRAATSTAPAATEPEAGSTAAEQTAVADTAVADTAVADTAVEDTAVADTEVADAEVADAGAGEDAAEAGSTDDAGDTGPAAADAEADAAGDSAAGDSAAGDDETETGGNAGS